MYGFSGLSQYLAYGCTVHLTEQVARYQIRSATSEFESLNLTP
jgi:hypothetical protein